MQLADIDSCELLLVDVPLSQTQANVLRGVPRICLSTEIYGLSRECRLAVLAHEGAHLALQHWRLSDHYRSLLRRQGSIPLVPYLVGVVLAFDQETAADQLAVRYLRDLGYDDGRDILVRLLEPLESKTGMSAISFRLRALAGWYPITGVLGESSGEKAER